MSDQFNRQKITREIERIRNQARQAQEEVAEMRRVFNEAYARVVQERDDLKKFAYEEAPRIAAEEANKQIEPLKAEIERLREELQIIANGTTKSFEIWAKRRARKALGQEAGTLVIKKGER